MRVLVSSCNLYLIGKKMGTGTDFEPSRTPWQGDEDSIKKIKAKGKVNEEGYVNVARELGLSGTRGRFSFPPSFPAEICSNCRFSKQITRHTISPGYDGISAITRRLGIEKWFKCCGLQMVVYCYLGCCNLNGFSLSEIPSFRAFIILNHLA